jgi:hypothetical protein
MSVLNGKSEPVSDMSSGVRFDIIRRCSATHTETTTTLFKICDSKKNCESKDGQTKRNKCCLLLFDETRTKHKTCIYKCRCDERLGTNVEGDTRLSYTGLCGGLEHLKIETRLNL